MYLTRNKNQKIGADLLRLLAEPPSILARRRPPPPDYNPPFYYSEFYRRAGLIKHAEGKILPTDRTLSFAARLLESLFCEIMSPAVAGAAGVGPNKVSESGIPALS